QAARAGGQSPPLSADSLGDWRRLTMGQIKLVVRIAGVVSIAGGALCLPVGYGINPKRDLSVFSNLADMGIFVTVGLVLLAVGIAVEDIDAAIQFFTELGLELEGRAPIEGDWADGVTGLRDMRVEIAMMRTPDGHSRLEMSRFLAPPVVADHRSAPVNALGYL